MAFDPIYVPDSDKETPKKTESDSKDEPPRFSPKIIFTIIGLLIGAILGYGLSQVFVTPTPTIEDVSPIIEPNDDELNALKNELENTINEIRLFGKKSFLLVFCSIPSIVNSILSIDCLNVLISSKILSAYLDTIQSLTNLVGADKTI